MQFYNTLSGKKDEFTPIEPGHVRMYACGPTVYNFFHVGNARCFVVFDMLRRYLEYRGYRVTFVQNFTDIDDKVIRRANEEGITYSELAARYIDEYFKDARGLGVRPATVHPLATDNIDMIIEIVSKLVENGHAYPSNGDVYFRTRSFRGYGKLSGQPIEDLESGARIDISEQKEDPLDFALWKAAKPGEPAWESPWGMGRPGWHIECSAMNMKAFGDQIDIHGGGRDLIFPHHENEIAQTEALTGKTFAKYWIHNGLIKVNGQKMSKSLGNSLVLHDLLEAYHPETIKFALLQTNYRGDINVTNDLFPDAEKHLVGFYKTIQNAYNTFGEEGGDTDTQGIDDSFNQCMDDDFNTAKALANLFGIFKKIKAKTNTGDSTAIDDVKAVKKAYGLLGFFREDPKVFIERAEKKEQSEDVNAGVPEDVMALVKERAEAKANKNWARADEIRGKITALGYSVKDTKDGAVVEKL